MNPTKKGYLYITIQVIIEEPKENKVIKDWTEFILRNKEEIEEKLKDTMIHITTLRRNWEEEKDIKICEEEKKYKSYLKKVRLAGQLIGYTKVEYIGQKDKNMEIVLTCRVYKESEEKIIINTNDAIYIGEETARTFIQLLRMIHYKSILETITMTEIERLKKKIAFELRERLSKGKIQNQFDGAFERIAVSEKNCIIYVLRKNQQNILKKLLIIWQEVN